MKKFYNSNVEEQETIINIDYYKKMIHCYTSRKIQIERLTKKLGNPKKTFYTNKKISGASWSIPFSNKKMANVIFSKSVVLGQL